MQTPSSTSSGASSTRSWLPPARATSNGWSPVLDPDIVLRADGGALAGASRLVRGARAVAAQAASFSKLGLSNQVVLVNGHVGIVSRRPDGKPFSVLGFTIASGTIVKIDILADPERLNRLDLSAIEN